MTDTKLLAALPSEEQFLVGLDLLGVKWTKIDKAIIDWFLKYWGTERTRNWFVSFTPPGLPNTNNSLESRNKLIKMFVTMHDRFSIGVFMHKLKNHLYSLSLESVRQEFKLTPADSRKVWVGAQTWLLTMKVPFQKKKVILSGRAGRIFVPADEFLKSVSSSKQLMAGLKEFNKSALSLPDEKFNSYVSRITSFYVLEPITPNGHTHYSCSCPMYHKYASCKHALGASIHFGKVLVPPIWNATKLTDKSMVGRPKKVGNCLDKATTL
jgi:hypothetical protein